MSENQNGSLPWGYLYILVITLVTCILSFLSSRLQVKTALAAFLIVLIFIIPLWKKQLSKKTLYLLDILNLSAALLIGRLITYYDSADTIIGIICGVSVIDVISFTKAGKNTLNAKLVGKTNTLARLSICLPIPKKEGLYPIIGIGDLVYYSVIIMYSVKSDVLNSMTVFFLVITGQLTNTFFISVLKRKHWHKGFPATLFPGVFFMIFFLIKM